MNVKVVEAISEIGRNLFPSETVDALQGKVDKNELIKLRLDNAKFYLLQAKEIDSPVIVSELLHKSLTEGFKALKDYFGIQKELKDSIPILSDILGNWIDEFWDLSLKLHYDGYIMEVIDIEDLKVYENKVVEFIQNCEIVVSY
ncbi:hypothetical protein GFB69_08585 [Acidianus ambivalens]|uniref:HEPN domain-containing protein n=1 Tax=Acidianus ambivalens TaxID=2283 RepID=A0A650CV44_ACIAM|nr:hypothetical protein [Acidianus ambivalens]QGR21638.1 hypothetical protein D1866_06240 [Acidianus ambivalens]